MGAGEVYCCPDDGVLEQFLDRTLSPDRTRALEEHFDLCPVCRELVYVLAGLDPEKIRSLHG